MSEKRGLYWRRGFTECFSNWDTVWASLFCFPCSFGKLASLSGFGRGVILGKKERHPARMIFFQLNYFLKIKKKNK